MNLIYSKLYADVVRKGINLKDKHMNNLAIMIPYRDRPTELFGLLQSIRTQTYKEYDIFIRDDASGTPIQNYYFLNMILMRIQLEGHRIFLKRNEFNFGVSRNRQVLVDDVLKEDNYQFLLRLDDDILLEPNYINELFEVIDKGYDIASGITTPFGPSNKRNSKFLKGIINRIILDENGNYIMNSDDCGIQYIDKIILPAHHFRSCALIKREVHEKIKYYPTRLSLNGFREEQIFSYKALINGFKIGVNTKAVNFHLLTPSGGERPTMNMVPFNQQILEEFTREHKDELNKLFTKDNMPSKLELIKETNLINRSKI